jgi:hypothetical protein
MLRCVALVRTDVDEELSPSFIRVTRISELGTMLALSSSETSVLTRAIRRNIPEDTILHSHRRENLKSYTAMDIIYSWRAALGVASVSPQHCILKYS